MALLGAHGRGGALLGALIAHAGRRGGGASMAAGGPVAWPLRPAPGRRWTAPALRRALAVAARGALRRLGLRAPALLGRPRRPAARLPAVARGRARPAAALRTSARARRARDGTGGASLGALVVAADAEHPGADLKRQRRKAQAKLEGGAGNGERIHVSVSSCCDLPSLRRYPPSRRRNRATASAPSVGREAAHRSASAQSSAGR